MIAHTIITDKMVFGGDCIAKIEGKNIFIPYAIPGETVEVEIEKDLGDYAYAKIVNIVKPSPHRVIPPCSYYGQCGGCNMMHIDCEEQKKLRVQMLSDILEREGINFDSENIEVVEDSPLGYRSRFQFHSGGLMEKRTNKIVPLKNCPCATPEVNKYLSEVPYEERPKGRVHVFGVEKITSIPDGYDRIIIAEEPVKEKTNCLEKNASKSRKTVNGRLLKKQKQIRHRFTGTVLNEHNFCTVKLCDKEISFDVQGFFQSNLKVLEKAIPHVLKDLEGNHVLDMYAGAGTFSTFLAEKFKHVTLVEHNRDALVYAERNLIGKSHESFGVSGETWIKHHAENCIKTHGAFDAVIIDPPRQGMEKEVCKWISNSDIPEIRYVSCDPATMARDAAYLIKGGYKLSKLYLLDFYPQTSHIESLSFFTRVR